MRLRARDRGLAVQVGVTILLGFIVIALATYQVEVVPQQNARVEFSHSQTVQGQLQDVRGAIVSAPGDKSGRSVSVQLGTTYPSRTIFLNPPPPTGQLRTANGGQLRIDNAIAMGETGDFWTGDEHSVDTTTLEYQPNYNVYQNGPTTVIDNTVIYDVQPRSGDRVIDTDQRLVDGDRINLVAVQGDYQRATGRSVAVDVRGVSTSTRTISVTGNGNNIMITVPTQLSAGEWEQLLDGEPNFVDTSDAGSNQVRIELDGSETYELRMAKVGLTNSVKEEDPVYVTTVEGDRTTTTTRGSQKLVAEVRDQFNNPVSGVPVDASVVSGPGEVTPESDTTDVDGQVEFIYESLSSGTATVKVDFSASPTKSKKATTESEKATFEVTAVYIGTGPEFPRLVYVSNDDSTVQGIDASGQTVDYPPSTATAFGPPNTDLNGGKRDVPYVDSNDELVIVDEDGNSETLDSSGGLDGTRMGVGNWDDGTGDTSPEVVYVKGNRLSSADPSESGLVCQVSLTCGDINAYPAQAVAGVAPFDGGDQKIVYVDDNDNLVYIDEELDIPKETGYVVGTANAVSTPADFDDDDTLEVAVVNGDNNIDLVEPSGLDRTIDPDQDVPTFPMGALDWNGDGDPDVTFKRGDGTMAYYDDGSVVDVTDEDDNPVKPSDDGVT